MKYLFVTAATIATLSLAPPAFAAPFLFTTGAPDGLLGATSAPATAANLETETADDFILTETTTIAEATITGLVPPGTLVANISNVEVEIYHVFPTDSVEPPSGKVPSRGNSPADFEIDSATRDGSDGTLDFTASAPERGVSIKNSVVNKIKVFDGVSHGEGEVRGDVVDITITFTPPIVLPADHYFFRPEVQVSGGNFLYLSSPRPIPPSGTPLTTDLQAWIRDFALQPDWLRIGTDIIADTPLHTFNMTFSLTGETIPRVGIPGQANCHGKSIAALTHQFGSLDAAASTLGFSTVAALQDVFREFCQPPQSESDS